jgi:hypothetical protein
MAVPSPHGFSGPAAYPQRRRVTRRCCRHFRRWSGAGGLPGPSTSVEALTCGERRIGANVAVPDEALRRAVAAQRGRIQQSWPVSVRLERKPAKIAALRWGVSAGDGAGWRAGSRWGGGGRAARPRAGCRSTGTDGGAAGQVRSHRCARPRRPWTWSNPRSGACARHLVQRAHDRGGRCRRKWFSHRAGAAGAGGAAGGR